MSIANIVAYIFILYEYRQITVMDIDSVCARYSFDYHAVRFERN
jgi:hypothetical protein